ncbi:MAG: ABC-type transport auxiliary lipoprotein family protein [Aquincola sp.]|nr:ABC-type transport auxiliary lipoprotein family protein [Aquincola sp.]
MRHLAVLACVAALAGCVSVDIGGDVPATVQLSLRDAAIGATARRATPLVDALLVQAQPADALADTLSVAYSRREGEYAFYQLASWTDRPVRQLPRLLQRRLEARGVAAAVGVSGDPMRADWLLTLGVDTLYHDVRTPPGAAHLSVTAELFDRRTRKRVAMRRFEAIEPSARADSAAAAQAMAVAVGRAYDELVPWLEEQLPRAAAR